MANIELAKAYVTIVPSMQGAQATISEELGAAGERGGAEAGQRAGGAFSGAIGVAAKVGAAAIGAAASGVSYLTTQAVSAYADYEQLTGGIETLYGESADQMMAYAQAAAQTTGQSVNEFMESAISTSAAMISACEGDQARAAELTNQAMIDMADNANKLGTDMEMIENAYRGFSRGNFTMLDNLALGFSGTKEGMQELLAQATQISGIEYDIDSYADIVEAIHVVQEEMGIAGTTAAEASDTIQGSLGALTASWENLITGIANPDADLGALIDSVIMNAETALGNLIPVISNALSGIGQLITQLAPVISAELPGLVSSLLPPILTSASEILQGLASGLLMALPTLAPIAADIVVDLVSFIIDNIGLVLDCAIQIIIAVVEGISSALPELIPAAIAAVYQIVETLTSPDCISSLLGAAFDLIMALGQGIVNSIPTLLSSVSEVNSSILDTLGTLGGELASAAATWAYDMMTSFISGIQNMIGNVASAASSIASTISSYIGFSEPDKGPLSDFHTYAPDMIDLFTEGIEESTPELEAAMTSALALPAMTAQTFATSDFSEGYSGEADGELVIPIYIGQEKLDTIMLKSSQLATYRRGS